jgi:hypothetical protein
MYRGETPSKFRHVRNSLGRPRPRSTVLNIARPRPGWTRTALMPSPFSAEDLVATSLELIPHDLELPHTRAVRQSTAPRCWRARTIAWQTRSGNHCTPPRTRCSGQLASPLGGGRCTTGHGPELPNDANGQGVTKAAAGVKPRANRLTEKGPECGPEIERPGYGPGTDSGADSGWEGA